MPACEVRRFLHQPKHQLTACIFFLIAIFLCTRLPFFLYYQIPQISSDSPSYLTPVLKLRQGIWPDFSFRPPGYPLFLFAALSIYHSLSSVMLAQNLLTLASHLGLLVAVFRVWPRLTVPAAVALGASLSYTDNLCYDCLILSESLYGSLLILGWAALLVGLHTRRSGWLGISSWLFGLTVAVRPLGIVIVGVFGLAMLFLFWNRRPWRQWAAFGVPLPTVLLLLALNNYGTTGRFALSAPWVLPHVLSAKVLAFWETNPGYPERVNKAIEKGLAHCAPTERAKAETTWDLNWLVGFQQTQCLHIYDSSEVMWLGNEHLPLEEGVFWMKRVAWDTIKKHPRVLLKCFLGSLTRQVMATPRLRPDYYHGCLPSTYRDDYVDRVWYGQGYEPYMLELIDAFPRSDHFRADGAVDPTILMKVHRLVERVNQRLFRNAWWSWCYLLVLLCSGVGVVRTRAREPRVFFLFLLTAFLAGAAAATCLLYTAMPRYAYPCEFIYYMGPALLPWAVAALWRGSQAVNEPAEACPVELRRAA